MLEFKFRSPRCLSLSLFLSQGNEDSRHEKLYSDFPPTEKTVSSALCYIVIRGILYVRSGVERETERRRGRDSTFRFNFSAMATRRSDARGPNVAEKKLFLSFSLPLALPRSLVLHFSFILSRPSPPLFSAVTSCRGS